MYRIAICDDEPLFAENLCRQVNDLLFRHEIDYSVTIFSDPGSLLSLLRREPDAFQLVLLDIMMGDVNGIDFARALRESKSRIGIIFITASPSFALEGYSVRPVQYLLKPVDPEKLKEAILFDYEQNFTRKRLLVTSGQKTFSLAFSDISFIEVYGHTLKIHTEKDTVECPGALKELESTLPDCFLRCHKSYIVNLERVSDIKRYEFTLDTGSRVPIGKEKYFSVQNAFVSYAAR